MPAIVAVMENLPPRFVRLSFGKTDFDAGPTRADMSDSLGRIRLTIYSGRCSWQDYMSVAELERFAALLAELAETERKRESDSA